ncbi:MAG: PQQ-binding-like beta-propeller repeat protein, partial [Verrucomicrobiales bacterium]|nr:PQQ-binding-like beta-propeller repeat protein [Verrucomicrobiales bacterium]
THDQHQTRTPKPETRFTLLVLALLVTITAGYTATAAEPPSTALFSRDNLIAWCIVPFDARQRGPEARAEMLTRMGITKLAYDWRAEHIPQFDEEMETLKRWNIELSAFWFPGALNAEAQAILDVLKRHEIKTELWVSMNGGNIQCTPEEQAQRVRDHAAALRPIVDAAAAIGCKVGLYNHGAWFGEPDNQIAILKELQADNVGIVYNLHHGHHHLDKFPELLQRMLPYLYCINLNGMNTDGEAQGEKTLPLGKGEHDLELLRTIQESGYKGPIGILGHTMDDVEEVLLDNLDGLDWLVAKLQGKDPGPRPPLRVGRQNEAYAVPSVSPEFGNALAGGMVVECKDAYRTPPITVDLRARLDNADSFNILVANDTKASGAHWEIFTEAGTGRLAVYTPGLQPDHLRTEVNICDGVWRHIAMAYGPDNIALYIDGEQIAHQAYTRTNMPPLPGALALGRLVEGGFYCNGAIDEVRICEGVEGITSPTGEDALSGPPSKLARLRRGGVPASSRAGDVDPTIAHWDFNDLPPKDATRRQPVLEDPARRATLPEFQTIPAANTADLTPALPVPDHYFTTWTRSHGDPHNTRFARAAQITRDNVHNLAPAWTWRSGDKPGNVQCNPICVDGIIYTPTSGWQIAAIDGKTGTERWRIDPKAMPQFRGLIHYPGDANVSPRLFFTAGRYLYALDPATGAPIATFGENGRVESGEVRSVGALFDGLLILPGYLRDVTAYDIATGERRWTFHTIPLDGEYGRDTWNEPEEGANCWGGMALDEARGIAYVATGSPKPNFAGNTHTGQNLFANCVIALDARTGQRLWHFQELRHDIWDIDIPAPPNLLTITREGKRVDVVAQVTKMGNTLVLDRVSGKPVFPFRLRRAPVSKLPGERTWPYQPDLELPEPFAHQAFSLDDVTERSDTARAFVLGHLERANFGWFEPFEEDKPTALYNIHGGAEWTGAACNPDTGRLYVSANNIPWIITVFRRDSVARPEGMPPTPGEQVYMENCARCHGAQRDGVGMTPPLHGLARRMNDADVRALLATGKNVMPALPKTVTEEQEQALLDFLFYRDLPEGAQQDADAGPRRYTHNGYPKLLDHEGYPGCKPPWGTLNCLDLNTGKLEWQVPLGTYPDLAFWGEDDTGAENFGGPSLTATGLVFCAGTPDEMIYAFDADTGAVLWKHQLPYGGYAPPSIFEIDGAEFLVIPATGGGKLGTTEGDALVAFGLKPDR